MDYADIFDYVLDAVADLDNYDIGNVADYALGDDWFLVNTGRDDVIDSIANVIFDKYFDSGAADDWGPSAYTHWFINRALSVQDNQDPKDALLYNIFLKDGVLAVH